MQIYKYVANVGCLFSGTATLSGWLITGRSWVRIPAGSYQRPSSKWYKLPPFMTRNALGLEFDSVVRLFKRPGSVWNCQWRHALKIYPGINSKGKVLFPGTGFLSSATWPSLSQKH